MSIINLMSVYTHSCFYPLWTCIMLFYFILWSFAIATFYLPQANEDLFCGCVLTEPEVWPLQYQCVIAGWFLVAIWENSATYWSGELSRVIIHREYNLFTTLCFCLACMTSQLLFFFFKWQHWTDILFKTVYWGVSNRQKVKTFFHVKLSFFFFNMYNLTRE